MDPAPLSSSEWSDIGQLLTNLWIMVGLVIFSATNVVVGHIFIPSLVDSFHLPSTSQRIRPVFYFLAVISFGFMLALLFTVIGQADVLERFWADYWI